MCQLDTNFYAFLVCIDEDLAAQTQARGCQRCGSPLHKNRYERRPRGGGLMVLGEGRHFHPSAARSATSVTIRRQFGFWVDGSIWLPLWCWPAPCIPV